MALTRTGETGSAAHKEHGGADTDESVPKDQICESARSGPGERIGTGSCTDRLPPTENSGV